MKRFLALTISLLLLGSSASAEAPKKLKVYSDPNVPLVSVDGTIIKEGDLTMAVNRTIPSVAFHSQVSERTLNKMRKDLLEKMIDDILIYVNKDRFDITVSDEHVDGQIEKLKANLPPRMSLKTALKESSLTLEQLKKNIVKAEFIERARKMVDEQVMEVAKERVDDAYMRSFYEKNTDLFEMPAQLHVKEILIGADPSGGSKAWSKSRQRAMEVLQKARLGEDFESLARLYSEDEYAEEGGDLGWAHEGSITEEIETLALKMEVGAIDGPVRSLYGYHIVFLAGKRESKMLTYDEVDKAMLKKRLTKIAHQDARNEWRDEIRADHEIKYLYLGE